MTEPIATPEALTWDKAVCGTCVAWEPFPWDEKCDGCQKTHLSDKGLCRFNPPTFGPDGERGTWPTTHFDDWCCPGRDITMNALHPEEGNEEVP